MRGDLYGRVPVSPHVPAERVVDFDYFHPPLIGQGDVHAAWRPLHDGPDIVWTACNGGHWILTRGEDIRFVQENYATFSHEEISIPRGASPVRMPPLSVDPPLHARYRAVLNPSFTPGRVAEMREKAATLTAELATMLRPRGGCEFVMEFARVMPVTMFLGIVDLPLADRERFVDWGLTYMTSTEPEVKLGALAKVTEYLQGVLDARGADPGSDLLSRIAGFRSNPRFEGEYEIIGMALLIFFGGLDTVANMLSFVTRHLATHPAHRRRLIEQPEIIPQAAEEYLRRFGLTNTSRLVLHDFAYKGVTFRQGDMVLVPTILSSMDERMAGDPLAVDFDRAPQPHNTFGNGPHKCVGSPLARAELQVFLQEWLRVIPDFRLDPDRPPVTHSGLVSAVDHLHLTWDA